MLPRKILVLQTAFLGDVVLTLPLVQLLHRRFPNADIDFVATPKGAEVLRHHPAIHSIIEYDKRGSERGLRGIFSLASKLKQVRYEVALVPHRSLRSALIVALSRIPLRVGFDTSMGSIFFTKRITYKKASHEIERNLTLLKVFGIDHREKEYPSLYPSQQDASAVDTFLAENGVHANDTIVAIAPGSVWNTKRWLPERFGEVVRKLRSAGLKVILVGGKEDATLCADIAGSSEKKEVIVAAGSFTILQSAELLRRCAAIVTNDTAPMHLAVAMRTPVVALFGPTVPAFGFAPYGERDVVLQTEGLPCRPCSIHGGDRCPIGTFDCMKRIDAKLVFEKTMETKQFPRTRT